MEIIVITTVLTVIAFIGLGIALYQYKKERSGESH